MGVLKNIEIAGTDLSEFNCRIVNPGLFDAPERDVTKVSIPGRSGDLLLDNGRFKNVTVEYDCLIESDDAVRDFNNLVAWLKSLTGYQRIEERFHPDEYRLGVFNASITAKTADRKTINFKLNTDCKPQRYLTTADREQKFTLMALDSTAHEYVSLEYPVFPHPAILYDLQWRAGMTAADWLPALKRIEMNGTDVLTRSQCVSALDLTTGGVDIQTVYESVYGTQSESIPAIIVIDHSGIYSAGYMTLFRLYVNRTGDGIVDDNYSGTHLPIYNPTPYVAKPSIRFFAKNTNGSNQKFMYGEGMAQIEIAMNPYLEDEDAKFIIDSETYNTYIVTASGEILNGNQYVSSLGYYVLPEFEPGQNYVHAYLLTDNTLAAMVYAYVTPRWFIV